MPVVLEEERRRGERRECANDDRTVPADPGMPAHLFASGVSRSRFAPSSVRFLARKERAGDLFWLTSFWVDSTNGFLDGGACPRALRPGYPERVHAGARQV